MAKDRDITILMPTFNRAGELRTTLESMTRLDREDLDVELVVIDNNSTDETRKVAESFSGRLPIRYLFAPHPGKNRALNHALNEVDPGRIVLFTDDDVLPEEDWLQAVKAATDRWPDRSAFGGKVRVVFPRGDVPKWTENPLIQKFAYTSHDCGDTERPYESGVYPFGPNYWLRREVLDGGRRFDEELGPRPKNRILGDEILFLQELRRDGYEIVYTPHAVVGHRIQPEMLEVPVIRRRAYTVGRGAPHISGLCHPELLRKHPLLWRLSRWCAMAQFALLYVAGVLTPNESGRVDRTARAMIGIGYNIESIRIAARSSGADPR